VAVAVVAQVTGQAAVPLVALVLVATETVSTPRRQVAVRPQNHR